MRKVAKISIESFNVVSDDEPEKKEQEIASLIRIPDSFKKIVVVKGYMKPWRNENGIQYVGVEQLLVDHECIRHPRISVRTPI